MADYRKIARALRLNNARKITKIISATDGVGTTPVKAGYVDIISPNTHYDIKGLTGFIPVAQYPQNTQLVDPNEVGSLDEFRFVETPNAKVFTTRYAHRYPSASNASTMVMSARPSSRLSMKLTFSRITHGTR